MPSYRITLTGHVDLTFDPEDMEAGAQGPQTQAELLETLWDMSLSLGDIEDLHLSIAPLTPEQEAHEARKVAEGLAYAKAIAGRLREERAERDHETQEGSS